MRVGSCNACVAILKLVVVSCLEMRSDLFGLAIYHQLKSQWRNDQVQLQNGLVSNDEEEQGEVCEKKYTKWKPVEVQRCKPGLC
jgi:hypothetical protein